MGEGTDLLAKLRMDLKDRSSGLHPGRGLFRSVAAEEEVCLWLAQPTSSISSSS